MNVKINDSTQSTEINWDKHPQLLEATTHPGFIVLYQFPNTDTDLFKGISLTKNENFGIGIYDEQWEKKYFKPFNGTITLSND